MNFFSQAPVPAMTPGTTKPRIGIQVTNGLDFDDFLNQVLRINQVTEHFDIIESDSPDVVIYGPYGRNIPPPGPYLRVAYLCENHQPDLRDCDFCFGVQEAPRLDRSRYFRIRWHGLDPNHLIRPDNRDVQAIAAEKTQLCNFIYSNSIPYREQLFDRLSRHLPITAPGSSRNNCVAPELSGRNSGDVWGSKRHYLRRFRYTLALESYSSPGYRTEKLTDPMLADSIPIYVGDPLVSEIFNPASFAEIRLDSAQDFISEILRDAAEVRTAEVFGPRAAHLSSRIRRTIRARLRDVRLQRHIKAMAEQILETVFRLEHDEDAYLSMLNQPWLKGNSVPPDSYSLESWRSIFSRIRRPTAVTTTLQT